MLRFLLRILIGATLVSGASLAGGCGDSQRPPEEEASPSRTEIHWPARADASRYRVQAWSGRRLLFEVTSSDTTLVLTPSLQRATAPFDTIEVQVRAVDATGSPLEGTHVSNW